MIYMASGKKEENNEKDSVDGEESYQERKAKQMKITKMLLK